MRTHRFAGPMAPARPALGAAFLLLAAAAPGVAVTGMVLEAAPPHGGPPTEGMVPSSPAFVHYGLIPRIHTCEGASVSPPLDILGIPAGAASLALIMADPDVPSSALPVMNFTHWLVWDMPVQAGEVHFAEGARPAGSTQGAAYQGPCPPVPEDAHRYHFEFHALDATLGLPSGANRAALETAMQGHILETATLVGLYDRSIPGVD